MAPAHAANEECTQLFDHLEHRQRIGGQLHARHQATLDARAIGDTHDAAGRRHLFGLIHEGLGHAQENIRREHGTHIDRYVLLRLSGQDVPADAPDGDATRKLTPEAAAAPASSTCRHRSALPCTS